MSTRKSWLESEYGMEMKTRYFILSALLAAAFGVAGCADYYGGYPGYGSYYGAGPYYGGGYGGGSVVSASGDRPYYHGAGYWSGRTYYGWRSGHWGWWHGQRVWRRGHYVVRGY